FFHPRYNRSSVVALSPSPALDFGCTGARLRGQFTSNHVALTSFAPSASNAPPNLFWSAVTVVYTLFAVLAPAFNEISVVVANFSATATIKAILIPSACTPSRGTLRHSLLAA
ncbi:hypothetical protein B0H17DRAFT_1336457, partial [Mycena rosella]